ncbi:nuclear transport factor 2 family protein [Novosphingobium kaempferiae]|uniref:nuclear transport factor 2 family protein n=1 Tax=Novosphingobium kaempferiae TaxID=2896849 RepID=UPI00308455D8
MSMTPEEITDLVDRLYASAGAGDWETANAMLTDDFVAYEADALPMAGAYRGKNGLKELFAKAMGMADVVGLDRSDLLTGKDSAIAVLTMRFADPALKPAELCEMFRFRDGKCCEIKPYYYDPAHFHAAAAAKAEAA